MKTVSGIETEKFDKELKKFLELLTGRNIDGVCVVFVRVVGDSAECGVATASRAKELTGMILRMAAAGAIHEEQDARGECCS